MRDNGYPPLPLPWRSKRPIIEKWSSYELATIDLKRHKNDGIGILTGRIVAVDIDVYSPDLAEQIRKLAVVMLGEAPRRIGLAPKLLMVYRNTGKPLPKLKTGVYVLPGSPPRKDGTPTETAVEILGKGQQMVAFNEHPDTGRPYEWHDGDPLTMRADALTEVTEQQLQGFLVAAEGLIKAVPGSKLKGEEKAPKEPKPKKQAAPQASTSKGKQQAEDAQLCREALRHVPNGDLDWDSYNRMMLAVKGALGHAGEDAFLAWAGKSGKYSEKQSRRDWKGCGSSRELGAGTIYKLAADNGWKDPRQGDGRDLAQERIEQQAREMARTPQRNGWPDDYGQGMDSSHQQHHERIEEAPSIEGPDWTPPIDLWTTALPPPPLPRDILPSVIEKLAFAKPDIYYPPAVAVAALSVCSMATSDRIKLEMIPDEWYERFKFWAGFVGPASALKTPPQNVALRYLKKINEDHLAKYEEAMKEWKKEMKEGEAGEDDKPILTQYFSNSANIASLSEILKDNPEGIGIVHNELSSLIAAMDGATSGKGAEERGDWLALHDGGSHVINRIQRGIVTNENHSASILGGITDDKLSRIVSNTAADGMLARMMLCQVPVMPPVPVLVSMGESLADYSKLVADLVENRPDTKAYLNLSPQAAAVFEEQQMRWTADAQLYASTLPRYSERLGKLRGLAGRFALGFHIIECRGAIDWRIPISGDQMRRACAYLDYMAKHDLAFYESVSGHAVSAWVELARAIADYLLMDGVTAFKLGDITRRVNLSRSCDQDTKALALDLLLQGGWIWQADGALTGRNLLKRGIDWCVNPQVHEMHRRRAEAARRMAKASKERLDAAVAARKCTAEAA